MKEILITLIIFVVFQALSFAATWKLFKLAGHEVWKAAVPIYSQITMLKTIERPVWWIAIVFIPVVGPLMLLIIYVDFLRAFDKRSFFDIILTLIFGIFYVGYINYKSDTEYVGVEKRTETLIASLMFAVIFAASIHTFIIQPMIVPTGSLENTIRIGDALLVEKLSYGSRVPFTPVAIPFADIFLRKAYLKEIQLPYFRFPGWRKLKQNDIVVFNYPIDSTHIPIDRKDPYVKRLLALPGDTITIDSTIVYVNGKEFVPKTDAEVQFSYEAISKSSLSPKYFQREFDLIYDSRESKTDYQFIKGENHYRYYFKALTDNHIKKLKANKNIVSIQRIVDKKNNQSIRYYPKKYKKKSGQIDSTNTIFPVDKPWNRDFYGPLYIPKKGDKVLLNQESLGTYFNIVNQYEENNIIIKNRQIFVDGKEVDSYEYEIQQDYFMLIGDNRHNSLDARFFGFVPEENIVGRPIFIWANLNQIFGFEKRTGWHWNRWMTVPNNDEPKKTSYGWYVFALLGIYFAWDYYRARKKKQKQAEE